MSRGLNRSVGELNAYRADTDHPCDIKTSLRVGHADPDEAGACIYEELLADGIEHAHGGDARCRQARGLVREVEQARSAAAADDAREETSAAVWALCDLCAGTCSRTAGEGREGARAAGPTGCGREEPDAGELELNKARSLLSSGGPFIAQEVSIRARHELHVYISVFVKVDPPTDQDFFVQAVESALSGALNEALPVYILEESNALSRAEQEVRVPVSIKVLPRSEAQIAYASEADLNGALFKVAISSVLVVASVVFLVDDEEVEQAVRVEVAPSELNR